MTPKFLDLYALTIDLMSKIGNLDTNYSSSFAELSHRPKTWKALHFWMVNLLYTWCLVWTLSTLDPSLFFLSFEIYWKRCHGVVLSLASYSTDFFFCLLYRIYYSFYWFIWMLVINCYASVEKRNQKIYKVLGYIKAETCWTTQVYVSKIFPAPYLQCWSSLYWHGCHCPVQRDYDSITMNKNKTKPKPKQMNGAK